MCESFPAFGPNMEIYKISPRIHSECGVLRAKPILNAIITSKITQKLFTKLKSEHGIAILIPLYCKVKVVNWLNDSEDMKLVVATHVVLFR